jgi:hypothetical protein
MIANQPANVKPEMVCTHRVNNASTRGSVTIAVMPDASLVVKKEIFVADGRVSDVNTIVVSARRAPQSTKFGLIRGRRKLSLQQEADNEARTRSVEPGVSLSLPRSGFSKLKLR